MAVVSEVFEREHDAGLDAGGVIVGEAEGAGDLVSGFEADAVDVARELVGVVLDDAEGVVAVVFVNLDG